jgi:hypothetical protein
MKVIQFTNVMVFSLFCSTFLAQSVSIGLNPVPNSFLPRDYGCLGCAHQTNTDPDPERTSPFFYSPYTFINGMRDQIPDFRTNTFDWRMTSWMGNSNLTFWNCTFNQVVVPAGQGIPTFNKNLRFSRVNNPFIYHGGYEIINGDNKPTDGWELIKQDFGAVYKDFRWDGALVGHDDTRDIHTIVSSMAYMLLYNKYSQTIRIIGASPQQGGTVFQQMLVKQ